MNATHLYLVTVLLLLAEGPGAKLAAATAGQESSPAEPGAPPSASDTRAAETPGPIGVRALDCRYVRAATRWLKMYESEAPMSPVALSPFSQLLYAQLKDFAVDRLGLPKEEVEQYSQEGVIQAIDRSPPERCPALPQKPSVYVAGMETLSEDASMKEVMDRYRKLGVAQRKDALLNARYPLIRYPLRRDEIDVLSPREVTFAYREKILGDTLFLVFGRGEEGASLPGDLAGRAATMSESEIGQLLARHIATAVSEAPPGSFVATVEVP